MTFGTTLRTDMAGIIQSFHDGHTIKVFRHSGGWSVQSPNGLLSDAGTDQFGAPEPLLDALKSNGIDRVLVEP